MKTLSTIFFIVLAFVCSGQEVSVIIDSKGYHRLIIQDQNITIDTIKNGFAFNVKIEDYKFYDENNLGIILQDKLKYCYKKYTKVGKIWERTITGQLAYNPSHMSAYRIDLRWSIPKNFRIIAEDVVTFQNDTWFNHQKISEESVTKNCKEFILEKELWIKGVKDAIEKSKLKSNEK